MPDYIQNLTITNTTPGDHPYFKLVSSIEHDINSKNWENLDHRARNLINHYPSEAYGWYALGIAQTKTGWHKESLSNFRKALYINPDMATAYYQIALAYYKLKDYNKAINYFNKAIAKGIYNEYIYYNIGNSWYNTGNNNKAIDNYLKSLSICQSFSLSAYALFKIYFNANKYQSAVNSLKSVIINEHIPIYLVAQAKALYHNESDITHSKLRESLNLLNSAISLSNDLAIAHYERAYVKSKLGDTLGFSIDRERAFRLNPKLRSGHIIL